MVEDLVKPTGILADADGLFVADRTSGEILLDFGSAAWRFAEVPEPDLMTWWP